MTLASAKVQFGSHQTLIWQSSDRRLATWEVKFIRNAINYHSVTLTRNFGYLDIWMSGYLNIWIFGYLDIWIWEILDISIFGYLDILKFEILDIWISGYLDIWIFGYLDSGKNSLLLHPQSGLLCGAALPFCFPPEKTYP